MQSQMNERRLELTEPNVVAQTSEIPPLKEKRKKSTIKFCTHKFNMQREKEREKTNSIYNFANKFSRYTA